MADDTTLIAYDGSDNSRRAIRHAGRHLANRPALVLTAWIPLTRVTSRATVVATGGGSDEWAVPEPPEDPESDIGLLDARVTNAEGVDLARQAGIIAEGRCVRTTSTIWSAIIEVADEIDAALIITGTRGATGLRSLLHSSVAEHVLKHGHRPVFIVPPGR
ncbi:universal stress protein [Millisia brevis]|uniref:universal stress protein n=1 Tax=Millisia brevis TaxID=264148 RepID=UPI00083328D2|nr:universal stress protein [Millisia brevis]